MHRNSLFTLILIVMLTISFQAAHAQQSLEEIEAHIAERWEGITAISATMQLNLKMSRSIVGISVKAKGPLLMQAGTESKGRYRTELNGTATVRPLIFLRPKLSMLMVSDGEYKYTEQRIDEKLTVKKSPVLDQLESSPGGGGVHLAALKERYHCKVLPSKTFKGRDVFVIECRPREGQEMTIKDLDRMLLYYDKETGFQTRTAMYALKKKKPITEMIFTDLKMNPEIDPVKFVYTPPEGVEVVEVSGQKEG